MDMDVDIDNTSGMRDASSISVVNNNVDGKKDSCKGYF